MRILTKSLLCLGFLLAPFSTLSIHAETPTTPAIALNGVTKIFQHPPRIIDERTFLPARETFEALDAVVRWDPKTRTVSARKEERQIELKIGSTEAYVNHRLVYLEHPALIIDDTTYVPLRFVGQALGATITWDERTRTVSIVTKRTIDPHHTTQIVWHDDLKYEINWLHEHLLDAKDQMDRYFDPTSEQSKKDRFALAEEIDEQHRSYKKVFDKILSRDPSDVAAQAYLQEYAAAVDHIIDAIRLSSRYRTKADEHVENCITLYERMAKRWDPDNMEAKTLIQSIDDAEAEKNATVRLIKREKDERIVYFIVPPSKNEDGRSIVYRMTRLNDDWTIDKKTVRRENVEEDDLIAAIERKYRNYNFKQVNVKRFMYDPSRGIYHAIVFSSNRKGGWNVFIDPYTKEMWEEQMTKVEWR